MKNEFFKYSIDMEHSFRQVFGRQYYHSAEMFENEKYFKKNLLIWVKQLKNDIKIGKIKLKNKTEIISELKSLENSIKTLNKSELSTPISLFGKTLLIINKLLGYNNFK